MAGSTALDVIAPPMPVGPTGSIQIHQNPLAPTYGKSPFLMRNLWKDPPFLMGKLWKITMFNGKTNWKDPPFYSWANELFRLGHVQCVTKFRSAF